MHTDFSKSSILIGLLLLFVFGHVSFFALSGFANDDCYITFRYAANVADGLGFVFNIGEKVLGTTTPLWTMMLSLPGVVLGRDAIPFAALVISMIAGGLTIIFIWQAMGEFSEFVRIATLMPLILLPKLIEIDTSGMEAAFVGTLMVGSFLSVARGKRILVGLLLGLLLLARIDTALWVGLLLLVSWRMHGVFPLKEIGVMTVVFTPWILFSTFYFGSPVPHSIIAKQISYEHLFAAFEPLRMLSGYLPFEALRTASWSIQIPIIATLLTPLLIQLVRLGKRRSPWIIWPIFFIAYNLAFSSSQVVLHSWYYLPGFLAYFLSLGPLCTLVFTAKFQERIEQVITQPLAFIPATIVISGYLLFVGLRFSVNVGLPFEAEYGQMAKWFQSHSYSGDSILVEPIGYVGWESKAYIHDPVGIVSPHLLRFRKEHARDSWWIEYVKEMRPHFIVLRKNELETNSVYLGYGDRRIATEGDREWWREQYRHVQWTNRPDPAFVVFEERRSK